MRNAAKNRLQKGQKPLSAPNLTSDNPTSDKNGKLQKHLKICLKHNSSPSKTEWQRQKDIENASNPAIDRDYGNDRP
jgi:hypothetical protein